ncbi:hypothetical protein BMF35_a1426 [Aurantiacibacter gangjinensis]|nr:hypothetical protein BMF35_a1426 [Aurantiacibacter gangjinensis]
MGAIGNYDGFEIPLERAAINEHVAKPANSITPKIICGPGRTSQAAAK